MLGCVQVDGLVVPAHAETSHLQAAHVPARSGWSQVPSAQARLSTVGQAGPVQATHRISCEANPCPRCCSGQGGPPEVTGGHKASAREASPGNHVRVEAAGGHGRPVAATTRSAHAGLKLASSKVRPRVAMGGHNVWVSQRIAPHCGVNLRVDTRNQVALLL